jgi:hypothetical protein
MFVSECAAGSAFQVTLKYARGHFVVKRGVECHFPRQVFTRVRRVAAVMLIHAMAQITGESGANFSGMGNAAEEIDIAQFGPPSRDTGKVYNVTLISARGRFTRQ